VHPTLAHLTDDILRPIGQLLSSIDEAIHRQGLELLEALAPAGPEAMRGAVIDKLSPELDLTGRDLSGANLKGANLIGAILTFDETIRWDAATRWPVGQAPASGALPSREHPRYRAPGR
jgi:hypothetical protein